MKQKLFTLMLAIAVSIGTLFAASGTYGDNLTWDLIDGVLTISGIGNMYDVNYRSDADLEAIPWYNYRSSINTVVVNTGVTSIGQYAFAFCGNLKSVTMPNTITSIGEGAFGACSSLTSVTMPDGVTSIGVDAFAQCTNLTSVTIPNSVTSIGEGAFYACTSLPEENNLRYADTYLVEAVDKTLTSYTIKKETKWIGDYAFYDCTNLKSVVCFATTPPSHGGYSAAFQNTSSLTLYVPNASISAYKSSVLWKYFGTIKAIDPKNEAVDGLYYNFYLEDMTAEVVQWCNPTKYSGDVIIPATVIYNNMTYSVTSIGEYAFKDCTGLTSIEIPNSVTSIGKYAFENCDGLTAVHISDIAAWCATKFYDSTSNPLYYAHNLYLNGSLVTDLVIPDGLTSIGDYAFDGCSLTSVIIPNSVASIGQVAFASCNSLKSVIMPNTITSIGKGVFAGCTGLPSITIPNSVTNIGDWAFYDCINLNSVVIGNRITSIGERAFENCDGLTAVHISDIAAWCAIKFYDSTSNPLYYAHNLYLNGSLVTDLVIPDGLTSIEDLVFFGCRSLTSITIPNSVTSIGAATFARCTGLPSITIPNSVIEIGNSAFYGCTGLTSIDIPNSVTKIEGYTFYWCTGLTSIDIPTSITNIEEYAFYKCTGLTTIEIPNSVTSIGEHAFYHCSSLTSIDIPNSVTSIGELAFAGCYGLTSITIGNGVVNIGESAFSNCSNMTSMTIGKSVTDIGSNAFYGCNSLTSVALHSEAIVGKAYISGAGISTIFGTQVKKYTIGDEVTTVGDAIFSGSTSLSSVEIGNSVTNVGDSAFLQCYHLSSVAIGNNVKRIGNLTFALCTGLTTIEIPNSVTSIGDDAFYGCKNLNSVVIGNRITSIGERAFENCDGLTAVHIADMAAWCAIKFYDSTSNPLCFAHNLYLNGTLVTDLVIPKEVTSIGNYAFINCMNLQTVTFPNSVTSIGSSAFYNCTSLTSINIPNSVTNIGIYAFSQCTSLTSVTIGNSITSIGYWAFWNCSNLTSVTCYATTPPELGNNVWEDVYCSKISLYVPAESVDAYKVADQWKDFNPILPIGAAPTETTDVKVTPTENTATVAWPAVESAYTYELVIKDKSGNVICTLVFNAQGQLLSIAFNAPANGKAPQQTQTAGFSFTVTGLEEGTGYDLTLIAKDESGNELDHQTVSFTTTGGEQSIEDIHMDAPQSTKILLDGQIYILRGEHVYDAQGKMVR